MHQIILVLDNIRSTHNVGSILRSADGFGVSKVYLCGITPYPKLMSDTRLPYLAEKIDKQIAKTALGAEKSMNIEYSESTLAVLDELKNSGYEVAALEQSSKSISLRDFEPKMNLALIVGNEVEGVAQAVLDLCDTHLEIPMCGKKESFNVSVATAIALYQLAATN